MGDLSFDVATGLTLGARERQEDTVVADFPLGAPVGFAVLSDGMGGHSCGDVASGIVATEMFSELKLLSGAPKQMEQNIGEILRDAVTEANRCIHLYETQNRDAQGMGATLVAPILFESRLYWVSVGDSPLYLLRDGKLYRLNEDHSYAAQIDSMHARGILSLEEAQNHPDRSALVSVLAGAEIVKIDCRQEPMALREGDIVLAASDGVHTLSDRRISDLLVKNAPQTSAQIGDAFLQAVADEACPDQDNFSLCVIKVMGSERLANTAPTVGVEAVDKPTCPPQPQVQTSTVVKIDRRARGGATHSVVSLIRKVNK